MFPMEFDPEVLSDLPLLDEKRVMSVRAVIQAIVVRRLLPYFEQKDWADEVALARASERCSIERLEDLPGRIRNVSVLTKSADGWVIHLHEKIFDYVAFGIPLNIKTDVEGASPEGRRALAFIELLLRHELEHLIREGVTERQAILSDAEFAAEKLESDPAYYGTLREALADEMGGLRGGPYLELLNRTIRGKDVEDLITEILNDHAQRVAELPPKLVRGAFRTMGRDFKLKVLEACYRLSRNTSYSLSQRSRSLGNVWALFHEQLALDYEELEILFNDFTERWGTTVLLQEMELPSKKIESLGPDGLFDLFVSRLRDMAREEESDRSESKPPETTRHIGRLEPHEAIQDSPRKSLKNRIEDARKNPRVPRSVLAIIDKNRSNLDSHSSAKYTELIDTLLAVPWGELHKIQVGPKEFTAGLNTTHYGLAKPKEIVSDFFSNLIWRYRKFDEAEVETWKRTGSAFLFVGPPGVGKTSLAISIAQNLGIPYHKVSLGGMRDESDLRGHGFTYEGSKPGAIVQGLIKMGVMNGMFILDEADKTEKFAIATLLEILDPEQNHLFHDKYAQTTVDIDLSNAHFILTANTLETVPAPVIDRCQVVMLNRYSVEEKVAIVEKHIIPRIRKQFQLDEESMFFEPGSEKDLLRDLIKTYTHEAGVRQLEITLRTLMLRIQRREMFERGKNQVAITHQLIKHSLEEPSLPKHVHSEDRIGEVLGLGVDVERGIGNVIPIQATSIRGRALEGVGAVSMIHATGNIERVMDESRKVATTAILHNAEALEIEPERVSEPVHLHFLGGSTRKDGPSAGGAIGIALASLLSGRKLRRDVAMTGEIDTHGRITAVGGVDVKLETAANAGCKTVIIPRENLWGAGGVERLPEALKKELQILTFEQWQKDDNGFDYDRHVLQVVAVDHITQADQVARIDEAELGALEDRFVEHAKKIAEVVRHGTSRAQCPLAVLVKEPNEIEKAFSKAMLCDGCAGCRLLVPRGGRELVKDRLSELDPRIHFIEFDPASDDIHRVLNEAIQSMTAGDCDTSIALVAPYFTLKQAGLAAKEYSPSTEARLSLYANNYSVQGVKLKSSKALMNRTFCRVFHLDPSTLEGVPFLSSREGVYMVDLSFIPEKYRLHIPRAREILNRCLTAWLQAVDEL
jgi:ATP-dependent Lon protease